MEKLERETLERLMRQFPSLPWSDAQLDELVSPKHGIISGFADLLRSQAALGEVDLGELGPAGAVTAARSSDD